MTANTTHFRAHDRAHDMELRERHIAIERRVTSERARVRLSSIAAVAGSLAIVQGMVAEFVLQH